MALKKALVKRIVMNDGRKKGCEGGKVREVREGGKKEVRKRKTISKRVGIFTLGREGKGTKWSKKKGSE